MPASNTKHASILLFMFCAIVLATMYDIKHGNDNVRCASIDYPGFIYYPKNSDLAPIEVLVEYNDDLFSYKTIFGEPIIMVDGGQIFTTSDSGQTWHTYNFYEETDSLTR